LEHVAAAEASTDAHQCEEDGEEPSEAGEAELVETAIEVSHRPTENVSVVADLTIHLPERAFGELRGHAEETRDYHPENRARTADGDRHRNTRDVSETDRCRQRRGECLEVRHLAGVVGIVVVTGGDDPRVFKGADVDEAEAQGEEGGARDEPEDDEGELKIALGAIVPEDEVEEEDLRDRSDHVGAETLIEGAQHATDACPLGLLRLGKRGARPQARP
jgi:hypothetical protein